MTVPFAAATDVGKGWRALSADELARAVDLIAKASRHIRAEAPTIDARIIALKLDPELVSDVVCDMVRRALVVPTDQQPATQMQQGAGPFSMGITYANPSGELYLTKSERRKLGMSRQRAATVDMLTVPV